ncbi:TRAP-type C4-dicarboxylate transport system, small permease component [Poseidonocella pacifica]|uniref:TRAP transporter small permease protein n=1 Tax=Poseidonocella pacifica TaxID=871651 RepID=A0A1I0YJE7_9RHOB|nr:TRAP transporter small permease [Poseidonocella pacifica]SFB13017.1 TRAP-type C4-dicarboxylate transport system, small permease component [Poseidonocella pacifica]
MAQFYRQAEFAVGALILATITGLVFLAAVMRFFGHPLIWSVDLAQLLFIWLCFIGATRALREKSHLGVDLAVRLLPFAWRRWVETALALLTIAFLAVLARQGLKLTLLNIERQFGDSGLSYAWVTIAVPVGCVLLGAGIIVNLVQSWKSADQLVFTRQSGNGAVSEL